MTQFYTADYGHSVTLTYVQAVQLRHRLALPETITGEIPVRFLPTMIQKLNIVLKSNPERYLTEMMTLTRVAYETKQPIFWRY